MVYISLPLVTKCTECDINEKLTQIIILIINDWLAVFKKWFLLGVTEMQRAAAPEINGPM